MEFPLKKLVYEACSLGFKTGLHLALPSVRAVTTEPAFDTSTSAPFSASISALAYRPRTLTLSSALIIVPPSKVISIVYQDIKVGQVVHTYLTFDALIPGPITLLLYSWDCSRMVVPSICPSTRCSVKSGCWARNRSTLRTSWAKVKRSLAFFNFPADRQEE
jgi:hypothetical protein